MIRHYRPKPSRVIAARARGYLPASLPVADVRSEVTTIVLAAEPITDVDTTAAEMLLELDRTLAERGIELAFAELKDPVVDRLRAYGLREHIGDDYFFPTIGVAVKAFRATHAVDWQDWEEESDDGVSAAPQK